MFELLWAAVDRRIRAVAEVALCGEKPWDANGRTKLGSRNKRRSKGSEDCVGPQQDAPIGE